MDKISVIWKSYHEPEVIPRGYWDQGLLEDIFKKGEYEHHTDFEAFKEYREKEGAIVIINGRTHIEDTEQINEDISKLAWVLFIDTGDEEALFPWREIKHPVMRVWIMLPRMNQHDDVSFHLPNGYRAGTPDVLKQVGIQSRDLDFSFIGQINHPRREQCMEAAKALEPEYETALIGTDSFGKETLNQRDYMQVMARSKIVLCPSGIESPDNFRLYEALEAGCIPIVDAFATNNQSFGFWRYLFGDDIPFPIVNYWDELPKVLPELLKDYPHNANKISSWWQLKKREINYKLIDDVKELSK